MDSRKLRQLYLDYFKSQGHTVIPSASLIPENDPSVLFTTAGMHPLVPFLLGESHPAGKRLTNAQKCIRTGDIDDVGDNTHLTFFEMMGNWSLGDYWKKEAISFSYEFLTSKDYLGLDVKQLAVTVFAGDNDCPFDQETYDTWLSLGIPEARIARLDKEDNWWPAGGKNPGPQGPDTEMFYWTGEEPAPEKFDTSDKRWVEIWNDVFMQYDRKQKHILVDGMNCLYDENFIINSDLLAVLQNYDASKIIVVVNSNTDKCKEIVAKYGFSVFSLENEGVKKEDPKYFTELISKYNLDNNSQTIIYIDHSQSNLDGAVKAGITNVNLFTNDVTNTTNWLQNNLFYYAPLKQKNVDTGFGLERTAMVLQGKTNVYETELFQPLFNVVNKYCPAEDLVSKRIVIDHLRASMFIMADDIGIVPANVNQGYVVRKLLRRAIRNIKTLQGQISLEFITDFYNALLINYDDIYPELKHNQAKVINLILEESKLFSLSLEKGTKFFNTIKDEAENISGNNAFILYSTYGFPLEMTIDLAKEINKKVEVESFNIEFAKHQELSRTASAGMFKGGLVGHTEQTIKYHTATHLLHKALKLVLGDHVQQKGSNITDERMRFDFSHDQKMTPEQIKQVEDLVNKAIQDSLEVTCIETSPETAKSQGAVGLFSDKYGDLVKVYSIGDFSKEICGGPHVNNTKELGIFKIVKEEASSSGVRRIKGVLT